MGAATRLAVTVSIFVGIAVAANADPVSKQCGDQWRAAKANGTTNGQTWSQFLDRCRAQYHKNRRHDRTKSSRDATPEAPEQSTPTTRVIVAPTPAVNPWEITPQQEDILARQFTSLESVIPKRFAIIDLPSPMPDSQRVEEGIHRAFARDGIDVPIETQLSSSPTETGIIFMMPDPKTPPEFALRLKDAFGSAGINGIKFVAMSSETASRLDFTIFVGLASPK